MRDRNYKSFLKKDIERLKEKLRNENDPKIKYSIKREIQLQEVRLRQYPDFRTYGDV